MKRYYLTLLCGLLCAFFISASLQAATPALELEASKKSYDLTAALEVLEDPLVN
jgi:hypothetical protein